MSTVRFDGEDFDYYPQSITTASKWLVEAYEKLGRPEDPLSEQGEKMMNLIVAVWQDLAPKDAVQWAKDRKDHLDNEMDVKEQSRKGTGRSLASIPYPVYTMMKKIFPNFDVGKRETAIKFVKRFPIFRMANKI